MIVDHHHFNSHQPEECANHKPLRFKVKVVISSRTFLLWLKQLTILEFLMVVMISFKLEKNYPWSKYCMIIAIFLQAKIKLIWQVHNKHPNSVVEHFHILNQVRTLMLHRLHPNFPLLIRLNHPSKFNGRFL